MIWLSKLLFGNRPLNRIDGPAPAKSITPEAEEAIAEPKLCWAEGCWVIMPNGDAIPPSGQPPRVVVARKTAPAPDVWAVGFMRPSDRIWDAVLCRTKEEAEAVRDSFWAAWRDALKELRRLSMPEDMAAASFSPASDSANPAGPWRPSDFDSPNIQLSVSSYGTSDARNYAAGLWISPADAAKILNIAGAKKPEGGVK